MSLIRFGRALPALTLMLAAQYAGAQSSIYNPNVVWRKTVTRDIEFRANTHPGAGHDSSLAEMMVAGIMAGQLTPAADFTDDFTHTLMREDIESMFGPGKATTAVYDSIYRYRIVEGWLYNPATCAADIKIHGIAPIRRMKVNGVLRDEPLFWLSYRQAVKVLDRYRSKHPANDFYSCVWNDYFANKIRTSGTLFKNTAVRTVDFADGKSTRHFIEQGQGLTFMNTIDSMVTTGAISVYDTAGNTVKKRESDSASQKSADYSRHIDYPDHMKIVEFWTYNIPLGEIHIHNLHVLMFNNGHEQGIAAGGPAAEPSWFGGWIRYSDVRDVIATYEQTHPASNFATNIWNNYFYSDAKPGVVK